MLVAWRAQYLPGTQGVFDELSIIFKLGCSLKPPPAPSQALYNPKERYLIHILVLSITTSLCLLLFSLRGGGGEDWGFGTEHAPMSFLLFPRPVYSKKWASVLSSLR